MNKKTIFRMILLMVIGGVVGGVLALGLLKLNQAEYIDIIGQANDFMNNYNLVFHFGLIVCLYLPALYQYRKAKRNYNKISSVTDEKMDEIERAGDKSFHISMLLNGIFLILNFLLLGMTFNEDSNYVWLALLLFLISIIAASTLEVIAIRYIQKIDNRLKGDPTSFKFNKQFLESCDEAEKLKIYKTAYKAYQFSKNVSLGFIVITILFNMTMDTGVFPIFVSCMIMLAQIISYNYYSLKERKPHKS